METLIALVIGPLSMLIIGFMLGYFKGMDKYWKEVSDHRHSKFSDELSRGLLEFKIDLLETDLKYAKKRFEYSEATLETVLEGEDILEDEEVLECEDILEDEEVLVVDEVLEDEEVLVVDEVLENECTTEIKNKTV